MENVFLETHIFLNQNSLLPQTYTLTENILLLRCILKILGRNETSIFIFLTLTTQIAITTKTIKRRYGPVAL